MFDLEHSIGDWRQQLLAAGITAPAPLAELESHLREEVDQQMRAGSSAQSAFEAAVEKMGSATALKDEFEKIPIASPLLRRQYLCLYCFIAAPLLLLVNVWTLSSSDLGPIDWAWGLATMSFVALYIGGLPFWYRRLPKPQNQLVRTTMIAGNIFMLVWPLLATFISLGSIHLNLGVVVEMLLWSMGTAWFATWLAYALSDPADMVERDHQPTVFE
jgi:hypothetical protein